MDLVPSRLKKEVPLSLSWTLVRFCTKSCSPWSGRRASIAAKYAAMTAEPIEKQETWSESPLALTGGCFILVIAFQWRMLSKPPVWDGIMGMYAAAATLSRNGFDILALLRLPGFDDGGPNVYGLSPVTWLTATVINLSGSVMTAIRTLHILHWLIGAAGLVGVYHLARRTLPAIAAWAVVILTLVNPLVAAQLGDVYLEIPLLTACVWTLVMLLRNRVLMASLLAMLSTAIKPTGLVVVGALALYLIDNGRLTWRPTREWLAIAGPLAVGLIQQLSLSVSYLRQGWIDVLGTSVAYATKVGDAAGLILLAVIVGYFGLRRNGKTQADAPGSHLLITFLVAFHIFFMLVAVFGVFLLPRYYLIAIPFAYTIVMRFAWAARPGIAVGFCCVAGAISVLNADGALYRVGAQTVCNRNYAILERSGEYRWLLDLHLAEAHIVEAIEPNLPIYVTQPLWAAITYPEMGYVRQPPTTVRLVMPGRGWETIPVGELELPAYMVVDSSLFGGEILLRWWEEAAVDRDLEVAVISVLSSPYEAAVVRIGQQTDPKVVVESSESRSARNAISSQACSTGSM